MVIDNKSIGDLYTNLSFVMKADRKFHNCKDECTKGDNSNDCVGFLTYQYNGTTFCQLKAVDTSCEHSIGTASFVRRDVPNHCKGNVLKM